MLTLQWVMVLGLAIIFCLLFAVALLYALPFYGRWLARYPSLGCLLARFLSSFSESSAASLVSRTCSGTNES